MYVGGASYHYSGEKKSRGKKEKRRWGRRNDRKGRRLWSPISVIGFAGCMGAVSLALTLRVLAASGHSDKEITADMEKPPLRMEMEGGVSSNTVRPEKPLESIETEKKTEEKEEFLPLTVPDTKTMYLTFDDGPSEENTARVLDALKEKNVKATFFVVGENVRRHPEIAKRIVEEGHAIGIHCDSHNYDVLYESVESYLADFEKAYETVREVTGAETRLFRFPGGSVNAYNQEVGEEIIKAMTEKGFIYFDWNASLEDAVRDVTSEQLLINARETTLDRKKVVMLAHDVVYETSVSVKELIEQFPEYRMEILTPETEPIQF